MKRALIITYYWPPAGGPGVQRWLKFVKYLPAFEVMPMVYVPENPSYPMIDHDFSEEVKDEIQIIKHPIKEPYRFASFFSSKKTKDLSKGLVSKKKPSFLESVLLYLRGNFFIPDARVGWVKPSVSFLLDFLENNKADVLITTGPPHSLHLIGLELKKRTGLPWLADFRDPWTTIHYHDSLRLTKKSQEKHLKLESEVLNKADGIIVTSPGTKKEFKNKTDRPVYVITNGFDEVNLPSQKLDDQFSIAHIGSLLNERNPEVLWKVLAELCNENEEFSQRLKLKFAGAIGEDVKESLIKFGLAEKADFLGYLSHPEALMLQRQVQVLLLLEIDSPETRAIIPGKLFEYLNARRPILALGPQGSDIKELIEETRSGSFFNYAEEKRLKLQILDFFRQFQEGTLKSSDSDISSFSRRSLTGKLSELIHTF